MQTPKHDRVAAPVWRLRVLGRGLFEPHLLAFAPGALAAVKGGIMEQGMKATSIKILIVDMNT